LTTFINISTTGRKSYRLFKTITFPSSISFSQKWSSKFNRVAPIVVDAPESIRTESNYGKIALEDFDEITTYSKMSPDIRILDFSDAFTSEAQDDDLLALLFSRPSS
jgi:hypothetical protein